MGRGEDEDVLQAKELAVQRLEGKREQANLENKYYSTWQEQSDWWWYEKIGNLGLHHGLNYILKTMGVTYSDFHVRNLAAGYKMDQRGPMVG